MSRSSAEGAALATAFPSAGMNRIRFRGSLNRRISGRTPNDKGIVAQRADGAEPRQCFCPSPR